jgi:predicted phage replisome organizer
MADVKWIKVYTDMFIRSRKIKKIERMSGGDTILIIWLKLLLLAGDVNDGGAIYITSTKPYDIEDLADEFRRSEAIIETALSVFESYDMIERENGFIYISSWEEYQNADKLAEIRAKDRERKRLQRAQAREKRTVHGQSTDSPQTEREEEKDKEKESHSIIHSSREREDALLLTCFDAAKVEFATESERAEMLKCAKERLQRKKLGKGVVMLSGEQIDSLLDELSLEEFDKYFDIVENMELSGKHYKKKTHYQAILDMAAEDRKTRG